MASLLTVSQLNEYLKMLIDGNPQLGNVFVRGEISNFTNHYKTGHFYFSLKDETGLVRAVMFRSYTAKLRFLPQNGMKVILHGRVSVFPRDGQYQIYADDMQPDGVGALFVAYEQLRRKLEAEGLFDPANKRPLPRFPERIGLITSPTGAAVRDMIQILGRRSPATEVILYPALVQGAEAPASLVDGLRCFDEKVPVDLIIIGRGGGSAEDLWGFNDERLARAVAASTVPVISAVGHETDVTICDFAADLRAPTPSAAAELAVPDENELRGALNAAEATLTSAVCARLQSARSRLATLSASHALQSPRFVIEEKRMTVAYLEKRLCAKGGTLLTERRAAFAALCAKLDALNPLRVLSRGYAAVFDGEGKPLTHVARMETGDTVSLKMADGTATAEIVGIRKGDQA